MSEPPTCPAPEHLGQFLSGRLPDTAAEEVARHFLGCDRCLGIAAAVDRPDPGLAAAARGWERVAEPDALNQLIRSIKELGRGTTPRAAGVSTPDAGAPDLGDLLGPAGGADEIGRLGPFGVLKILGAGGMGVVLLARQERPRRLVAVKVIGDGAGGASQDRFRGEADAAARLGHPNLVPIYEVGEHRGRPYFAMEFVEGGNLAQRLAAASPAPRAAAALVGTLAGAMQHAHDRGILHRDLKPSNVLLTADGTPKVTDFGLAKWIAAGDGSAVDYRTQTGSILGTPAYMAPEQAAGGTVGPAADVYALGVILYEALAGRPPFRAASPWETLEQVRTCDPVPPSRLHPGLPRDLQTICLKCLEKDPARRYASAAALAEDLRRFLAGEPIAARPASSLERLRKWARRKPALAGLAGSSVLFLLTLAAAALTYQARLRAAVGQAEASAAAARAQERRVVANYSQARDTLDRMLDFLEQAPTGEVARLTELQERQAAEALRFFETIAGQGGDADPGVVSDRARAHFRAGLLHGRLGRLESSRDHFLRALELWAGVETDATTRQFAAVCRSNLGNVCSSLGDNSAAERWHREALGALEELARERPGDGVVAGRVAWCHHNLGVVCLKTRERFDEAERHFLQAVHGSSACSAAQSYNNLIHIYAWSQRPRQARAAFEEVENLLRPLLSQPACDANAPLTLAAACENLAELARREGDDSRAVELATRGLDLTGPVLRQEPRLADARERAFSLYGTRASALGALGRHREAVEDWDRVIEYSDAKQRDTFRVSRAYDCVLSGQVQRALAEADALCAGGQLPDVGRYNLACVYALTADGPGGGDAKAIALLRRLRDEGFFRQANRRDLLANDPDLAGLRRRDDFRPLLAP